MIKKETRHSELASESQNIKAPYELPEGWKWCRLGDVAKFVGGGTPDKSNSSYWNGKIPWASVKDIKGDFLFSTEDFITELGLHESSASLCDENGLILVTRISPGKSIISKIKTAINQDLKIVETEEFKPFLKYFFDFYEEEIKLLSSGTTVKGIKLDVLNSLLFPLPPTLAEQQRIVNRIETMFAKLDQAQEKAQSVVDSFETRKAAILHKAFTGELTANWRKENGVNSNISESTFKDICTKITDGFHNSPKPVSKGYPYIMAGDIREDGIDFNNGLFMDEKNHKELYNKAHPEKGDILVVNIGAGTGKSAIIEVEFEFSFKNCALLKLNKEIVNSNYVYLFFNLKKDYILKEITRGGAQPFLSLKMINELSISYPTLPEQQEIVRILDTVLEKESRAKEAAQTVLDQIALLKKSILARAFRGEL